MLLPRTQAPAMSFPLVGGGDWSLADQKPDNFTLIVVYRGLHCPICKMQLQALQGKLDEFASRGVNVVAVSTDDTERAGKTREGWELDKLPLGYGLTIETARAWGLYVSSGINKEPAQFSEPGLFLVRPDGELFYTATQNMPFGRPPLDEILMAIDFVTKNNYPARGELPA